MNIQEQTLYPSLPPQVVGKKFGEVILKFTKFVLYSPGDTTSSTKNPQTIPGFGYKVKFRFWGQQSNDIILISLPWKVGNPIEEAIFPIRVNRYYFEEYLSDMNELNFEIIDNKGKLFGYATVKMESIIHRNLIYRDGLSIYKDSGAKKIEIGKLFFEFVCHFDQNSSLENKPQLSVFQRVEALVSTDASSKYTEWPDKNPNNTLFKPLENSQKEKEATSSNNLPPLLARRAAARKHLAGLRKRNDEKGFIVFPNTEDDLNTSLQDEPDTQINPIQPKSFDSKNASSAEKKQISAKPDSRTSVLDRAKELLDRVKVASSKSSSSRPQYESITNDDQLNLEHVNWSRHSEDIPIDWLLRGVPEIYEETNIVSDDLVEQLLAEGGLPPSQIQYPILYSTNQAIISMLRNVRQLHLKLIELFVFGARCGLRKDGTFLFIRPPPGCSSSQLTMDSNFSTFDISPPNEYFSTKHKNILKHYHVGHVNLDHTLSWDVNLTDSLIQEWLNYSAVTGTNCIQIEIYSYLTPRSHKGEEKKIKNKSGRRNSAVLIGHAFLPLDGLFSSSNLLVHLSVPIVLDQASHTLISDRFQRMPIGVKLKPLPLGNSAGYIKCQLSLRDEHGELLNKAARNANTEQLNSIVLFSDDEKKISVKPIHTDLEDALTYLPVVPEPSSQRRLQYLCVALHHITFSNFESFLLQFGLPLDLSSIEIVCVYKVALSSSRSNLSLNFIDSPTNSLEDHISHSTTTEQLLKGEKLRLFDGKIHPLSDQQLPAVVYFEIWIQYRNFSKLIGLFSYSFESPLSSYSINNLVSNLSMGVAKVEMSIQETEERAKLWIAKCLTNENIRTLLTTKFPRKENLEEIPTNSLNEQNLVPDKPQEERLSIESECLEIPPQSDLSSSPSQKCESPTTVAPPKFSEEPTFFSAPVIVTQPLRPESVQISTMCSIDSLEQPVVEHKEISRLDMNISFSAQLQSIDQSIDSLALSEVSKSTAETGATHILEFSLEGTVDLNLLSKESLGYFVCYNLPGLKDHESPLRSVRGGLFNETTALWWDNECSILNSRNIHTFESISELNPLMTLGFDSSTSEFELLLVMSDLDGNLPVTPRTTFKAHFPISILAAALKRPNFRQRLDLAIEGRDSAFHGTLPLLISHRLAPGLLGRTSVDNEHPKSPLKVVEDQPKELFRIYGHVEEILHLTDLPNLPASNEIFLFFSVTSQGFSSFDPPTYVSPTRAINSDIHWDLSFHLSVPDNSVACEFLDTQLNVLLYSRPKWLPSHKLDSNGLHIGDVLAASTVIDLRPLFCGLSVLDGWYHIMNQSHRSIGQIKLIISLQNINPDIAPSSYQLSAIKENESESIVVPDIDLRSLNTILQELEDTTKNLLRFSVSSSPSSPHTQHISEPSNTELDWDIHSISESSLDLNEVEISPSDELIPDEEVSSSIDCEIHSLEGSYVVDPPDVILEPSILLSPSSSSSIVDPFVYAADYRSDEGDSDWSSDIPVVIQDGIEPQFENNPPHPSVSEDNDWGALNSDVDHLPEFSVDHLPEEESENGTVDAIPSITEPESEPPLFNSSVEEFLVPEFSILEAPIEESPIVMEPETVLNSSIEEFHVPESSTPAEESPIHESPVFEFPLDVPQPAEQEPIHSADEIHDAESDSGSHSDDMSDVLSKLNIEFETEKPNDEKILPLTSSPIKPIPILPFSPIVPPSNVVPLSTIINQSIPQQKKENPATKIENSHKCNLSQDVKDISDIIRTVMKSTQVDAKWEKSPGRRRQFVDAETNRISKAMKLSLGGLTSNNK